MTHFPEIVSQFPKKISLIVHLTSQSISEEGKWLNIKYDPCLNSIQLGSRVELVREGVIERNAMH